MTKGKIQILAGTAVLQFLGYSLHDGAPDAEKLDYVPFPDSVVKRIEASWGLTLHVSP